MKNIYKIDVTSECGKIPQEVKRVFQCVAGDPNDFQLYCSYWERFVTCDSLGYQFDFANGVPIEFIEQFEMDFVGSYEAHPDYNLRTLKNAPLKEWGSLPDEGSVACQIDTSGGEYESDQEMIEDFFANGG